MNKLGIVAAVVCMIFVSSIVLVPNVHCQATVTNVKVLSYTWYVNSNNDLIVIGEVQNTGTSILQTVTLNAAAYDASGTELASASTMPYVSYLLPQQKAPFYIDFGNPGAGSSLTSTVSSVTFTVSIAPQTKNQEYPDLILHTAFNSTLNGVYTIMGLVSNIGNQTATDIRVVGTYYNNAGKVVAVGFIKITDPLIPNNSTTFVLSEFDPTTSMVSQISSYSLLLQTATLQGNANPNSSPTPPNTSSSGSSVLVYVVVGVVVIVVVVLAVLVFLRRRRNLPPPPPPTG